MKKYNTQMIMLLILMMSSIMTNAQPHTTKEASALTGAAASRAAALGKGMNLSVWLENEYYFNSTTSFPDITRFTESDIANLKSLCFQSVRMPVIFEGFASPTAPYAFTLSNANVVAGLNYVDSVIKWCADNDMMLVIDNHLADDNGSIDQTDYQITDNNYTMQAQLIAAVWKQVIARYGYADPNHVIFELRNEPNSVSDPNLRVLYQTVIDTVRSYDHTHTLVVGNTGYYDPIALSQSAPYSDTNIIYTAHIYDGDGYYGFCEQGSGGVANTDSVAGTHISFPVAGEVAEINLEMNDIQTWSVNHNVPVWLSEFGTTTLPDVYRDDTSRCNYIRVFGAAIDAAGMPWAYWDGYGPSDYVSGYGNPTPLYYGFSIFDRSNVLTAPHLDPCFASALHVGGTCMTISGIQDVAHTDFNMYPNPASTLLHVALPQNGTIEVYNTLGSLLQTTKAESTTTINIAGFAAGMYMIRISYDNGTTGAGRFIKE